MATKQHESQAALRAECGDLEALIAHLEHEVSRREMEITQLRRSGMAELEASELGDVGSVDDIAPEDALDHIVRMENMYKLEQRRNAALVKETASVKHQIKEQGKKLLKAKDAVKDVLRMTGWDGQTRVEELAEYRRRTEELESLGTTLVAEHKAAKQVSRKKEQLIGVLRGEVARLNGVAERLPELHNAIRVKEREIRDVTAQVEALRRENQVKDEELLASQSRRDTTAVVCLEGDNQYLREEIKKVKERRGEQERAIKMHGVRARQLSDRLGVVMSAIRDVRLEAQYERSKKVSLVPESYGDESDACGIIPEHETVPVEIYELLDRDLQAMCDLVSRKDVLLLEKKCAADALLDQVGKLEAELQAVTQQQERVKVEKVDGMNKLREELASKHRAYRSQIEELLNESLRLRRECRGAVPPKSPQQGRERSSESGPA